MVADLFEYPWFLAPVIQFGTMEELIDLMPSKIISPAEERHKENKRFWIRYLRLSLY